MARITRYLFNWQEIDAKPDLSRLELVLSVIPNEALLIKQEAKRKHGRNDYPIRPMWKAMIVMLSIALGHIKAKREDMMRSLVKRVLSPHRKKHLW